MPYLHIDTPRGLSFKRHPLSIKGNYHLTVEALSLRLTPMPAKLVAHLDPSRATKLVESGLQWADADLLAKALGVSLAELADLLGISQPTFFRRKTQKHFPLSESDHIMRFWRLWSLAEEVFENEDGARQWLRESQVGLQGRIPLHVAKSEAGAREVETLLQRIDYGIPA